jgi:hypothetical protein
MGNKWFMDKRAARTYDTQCKLIYYPAGAEFHSERTILDPYFDPAEEIACQACITRSQPALSAPTHARA